MKEFKEVVGIERDEIQFRDDLDWINSISL
jgi:hypothetical protein